ncbi:MAG: PKD domain-containing protein [Saprospiraceae bacterium]|nr:PKD domain-containing protein [Saprospiraceae bacterium]
MKQKFYLAFLLTSISFYTLSAQCTFTVSSDTICATESVQFTVDNPASSSWDWDFENDGNIDANGSITNFSFPQSFEDSTYQVVLYENSDSCSSQFITVLAVPDPSIGVPPGITQLIGNEIKACNGDELLTLEIYNASQTFSENILYEINWGDNSPTESFDNSTFSQTNTISHTYNEYGYFNIFITVTHQNGCIFSQLYTLYNGGNPSIGLIIPGNTVGLCAPATLEFPITNTSNNPPGTEYSIYVNGVLIESYPQDSLPESFIYTFEESSCGVTTSTGNYANAFDIKIVASNPCNSSTATIEPIEVSEPPDVSFEIFPDGFCAGSEIEFENTSVNIEVVSGNPSQCIDVLAPSWDILGGVPGVDWEIVSGNIFNSDSLIILFQTPGIYVIEMTVVSFACGPFTISQSITILEPPIIDASLAIDTLGNSGCAPVSVPLTNNSSGEAVTYSWSVSPSTGWYYSPGSDSTSTEPEIIFAEAGTYDILLLASNPCETLSWDTTIVVFGPPLVDPLPLPDSCLMATLNFSAGNMSYDSNGNPINQYSWEFPGGSITSSNSAFPTDIVYTNPGSYPVNLLVSNGCGDTFWTDTFDVQMPEPLVLSDPLNLCGNEQAIQLQADPPNGTWSGTGISTDGIFDPTSVSPGDFIVQYDFGSGACFVQGETTVSVLPFPDVQLPPPITLCANDDPVLLNTSPSGGSWTDPAGILNGNEVAPQTVGPGSFNLLYTFTDNNNCSDSDSLEIVINDYPQPVASDSAFCYTPGAVMLPAANPAGGSWAGMGVVNPAGLFDPAQTPGPGSYTLTYSLTDSSNCTGTTAIQIGIISPENVEAGTNTFVCQEDAPILLSDLASPAGGNWTSNSPGFTGTTFDPSLANPGSHWLYYTVGAGNCQVMDSIRIQIVDLTLTTAGPNQTVCIDGGPLTLNGYDPIGGEWSGPGISDPINGIFDPTLVGIGQFQINYFYQDPQTGCSIEIPKTISVKPKPEPDFEAPALGCIDQPIQFINQTPDALYYQWMFGDGTQSALQDPQHLYDQTGIYTVSLLATNAFGCQRDTSMEVQIAAPPMADFEPDNIEDCSGAVVNFTNASQGVELNFLWDFGNGLFSNEEQPLEEVTYAQGINDTTYQVELLVTNACGSDAWTETITVHPLPIADFGFTVDTGCSPLLLAINNITVGSPQSFFWDLGNGNFSSDSLPPIQTYTTDTTITNYTITLIAENQCGADTLSQEVVVHPEAVTAFFNASNTEGCAPFTVEFTDYTGMGTYISWEFGDGNTSEEINPTYTFEESGFYTVIQYASNACGADSTTLDIEVYPSPTLAFIWEDPLCENIPIQFVNNSDPLSSSSWDFGTGDLSVETNPAYQFPGPGSYQITLNGTGQLTGCESIISETITIQEAPVAAAIADDFSGCAPLAVSFEDQSEGVDFYLWNFGDNNSSIEPNPSHLFLEPGTYEVNLLVSNLFGCSDEITLSPIQVWPNPVANFSTVQDTFCGLPANVVFSNLSQGADGFSWDFGNSIQSNLNNPSYSYEEAGNYQVILNVFNQYGCADNVSTPIQIFPDPLADFAFKDTVYCSPQEISFENFSVGDTFYWNFGDGQTGNSDNPIHTYEEGGQYDVSLIASFGSACADTLLLPVPLEILSAPIAAFDYLDGQNGIMEFINQTVNADSYFWDFGDGGVSEALNPTHRFSENGVRQILLVALNQNGCLDTAALQITPTPFGSLFVPNALTPEQGDPQVRLFLPKGVGLVEYRLQIFSTYGELIWENTELIRGQPAVGWDGTHNGEILPQDVYVWKIYGLFEDGNEWKGVLQPNGTYKRIGSVTLIR